LYQLIIHACSEANVRNNNFLKFFPLVFVFQCEASERSPLASEGVRLRRSNGQVTRPDV
jgi:hypothetical protein